jgi:hypothetical protein
MPDSLEWTMDKSETSKKFLGNREKALEDMFFEAHNSKLLDKMREMARQESSREGLARITGIQDEELLRRLVELEISPETWAALALVPMVEVAWADDEIPERERRVILSAAEAGGVTKTSPGYALLEGWLDHKPDARLLQVWGEYTVALCAQLDAKERESLRREVLGRARAVAEAAGGILGLGNKINERERRVLDELEKAFRS